MEPRIQYAKTADGVSIAFWTLGEGIPFVQMPVIPYSHIELDWRIRGALRLWLERLAQKRMVIRYDGRGSGLSDRNVSDFSLDAHVLDLEAVVDCLNLEEFALYGPYEAGPVAIAYSAGHPERVSHLILRHAWARASDFWQSPQVRAFGRAIDRDWDIYTETMAQLAFGWSGGKRARRAAAYFRECVTPQVARAFYRAIRDLDVTDLLPHITCPTLVMHSRDISWRPLDMARDLASRIPGARLVVLEGAPAEGDEAALRAIDDLLGEGEEAAALAAAPSGLVTILFTDMESSTALRQRLGDAKAQELVRTHNTIVRDALKSHSGSEIKHTGDGIMASFPSASGALECAVAIQRGVAAHVEQHPDAPLGVYIGLNAGEPISEEKDLFGTSVDLARRICDRAEPGQILVSDVVRQLAMGKGFLFSDRGPVALRGFDDPVKLFEVRWREEG